MHRRAGVISGQSQAPQVVQGDRHRTLQRGGGGQARPVGHTAVHGDVEAGGALGGGQALGHQSPGHADDVGRPARHLAGGAHRTDAVEIHVDDAVLLGGHQPDRAVRARAHRDERAVRQRDRQAQARVVVGVLPDEVDPPGGGPDADLVPGPECPGEELAGAAGAVVVGPGLLQAGHSITSRRRSAMFSGVVSEIHAPIPDSDPARYLSLPGARSTENSCRCRRRSSRPSRTGAWCQAEL